ncbi:MAG: hypothetical protein RL199_203 [Pseudomonadota bacterium]
MRLAALLLLATACRCAGLGAGRPAEEYISPEARPALVIPSLVSLAEHLQAFMAAARGDVGAAELTNVQAKLAQQLGFDPLTKDGLSSAGIDPRGSFGLGAENGRAGGILAVPIGDAAKLDETIARLARDRAGAGVREERTVTSGGPDRVQLERKQYPVVTYSKEAGGTPRVATVKRGRHLLVGVGARALDQLLLAAALTPELSLAQAKSYKASLKPLGDRDLYVHWPAIEGDALLSSPVALGVSVEERALSLRGVVAVPDEARQRLAKLLPGGADTVMAKLPAGAPFYLRAGVDGAALAKELGERERTRELVEKLRTAAAAGGVDLDKEFFGALEPGLALSVGLSPTLHVASAMDPNPSRNNPAEDFVLIAGATVRDPATFKTTLEKLPALLPAVQGDLHTTQVEMEGAFVTTVSYERGELVGWLLDGNRLVVFSGIEGTEALRRLREGTGPAEAAFAAAGRKVLAGPAGAAFGIDMASLYGSLQQLPPSAFGSGPSAFMAKSAMSGVLRSLSHLRAVVAVAPNPEGALLDVTVSMP